MMGENYEDYIDEAYRTLRIDGYLWIVETATSTHCDSEEKIDAYRHMLRSKGFFRIRIEKRWKFLFISCVKE